MNRHLRGFDEHLVGQVTRSEQGQVVASDQRLDPGDRIRPQHLAGSATPPVD